MCRLFLTLSCWWYCCTHCVLVRNSRKMLERFCRKNHDYALRAKKWQICVASRLHILCYSGSIRVLGVPLPSSTLWGHRDKYALDKNALKNALDKYAIKSIFFMTQSKTPNTPKNPNYAKKKHQILQNTPNFHLRCFVAKKICSKFTHFLVYFLQA